RKEKFTMSTNDNRTSFGGFFHRLAGRSRPRRPVAARSLAGKRFSLTAWAVTLVLALLGPFGSSLALAQAPPQLPTPSSNVSVFASGLNNPRGLKFGPDGSLYVAEGGVGGTNSTAGSCTQVIPDVGPYTGSKTGSRISKIASDGTRTTVVDNLPSSQTSPMLGSLISGVADIAFMGNTLYAVLAGA